MQLHLLGGVDYFQHGQITFASSARRKRWSYLTQRIGYWHSGCCYISLLCYITAPLVHATALRQKPSVPPSFGHWWRSHHWPGPVGSTPAAASAAHSSYLCHVHLCWKLQRKNNPLGKRPDTEELPGVLTSTLLFTLYSTRTIPSIFPQIHAHLPDWALGDSGNLETHLVPNACVYLPFHAACRKWECHLPRMLQVTCPRALHRAGYRNHVRKKKASTPQSITEDIHA